MQDLLKPRALKSRLAEAARWAADHYDHISELAWALQVSENGLGIDAYLLVIETGEKEHRFCEWEAVESLNRNNGLIMALEQMEIRLKTKTGLVWQVNPTKS